MFSAEWFRAAPSIWASPAACISRSCRLIASTEPSTPTREDQRNVGTAYGESRENSTRIDDAGHERRHHRAVDVPVREPAGHPGADAPSRAPKASRNTGIVAAGQPGDLGDDRGDVAVHREHPAEADHAGRGREQHLRLLQRRQLAADRGACGRRATTARTRGSAAAVSTVDAEHRPVRAAPAEVLAEPGAGRDAGDGGDRRGRASPTRPRARGPAGATSEAAIEGGDAEVRAVRQAGHEAGGHHRPVAVRGGGDRVAHAQRQHQTDRPARACGSRAAERRRSSARPRPRRGRRPR